MLQEYNDQFMNDVETINYVNDTHLNDVGENKNLKIAAKKISDKYKKIRQKRKAATSIQNLHKTSETFALIDKKRSKKQRDKAAIIAAKKYQKNIKNSMAEFKKAKNEFEKLKIDPSSAAFAEEILDKKLLVKLKKSKYVADRNFFSLVNLLENNNVISDSDNVNRTDYVEKREIDHSTLYSFSAPFELFHSDVGNLEFLGKNATFPRYVLVLVDLFSSKVYTYPMKSRKQIIQKLEQFYQDV